MLSVYLQSIPQPVALQRCQLTRCLEFTILAHSTAPFKVVFCVGLHVSADSPPILTRLQHYGCGKRPEGDNFFAAARRRAMTPNPHEERKPVAVVFRLTDFRCGRISGRSKLGLKDHGMPPKFCLPQQKQREGMP